MKKIVSLLLAAVIALGMTSAVFAANPKITSQIAAIAGGDFGEKGPGDEIWLPLKKEAFDGATDDLTMSDVKTSKITVKPNAKSGSKAIDSVTIKEDSNKIANVVVKLVDPYTNTKGTDFEVSMYIHIDGTRQGYETVVSGSLANAETEILADTDYIDLSTGETATCEETTSGKVEVYLGHDVSIFVKMIKGKQYRGSVAAGPMDKDLDILDEYPDIEDVLTLKTTNLDNSGNIVKIDSPSDEYYVYDGNLNYLGTTGDMLPYSDKYYLAVKKLDIAAEDEPHDEDIDVDGGDEEVPDENADDESLMAGVAPKSGDNPDTGLSPIFGFAIAAGALSLGTVITTSVRKSK